MLSSGMFRLSLFAALMMLVGCSSSLTKENAEKLKISETTGDQVVDLLGSPKVTETISNSAGSSVIYTYDEVSGGYVGPIMWANYSWLIVELRDNRVNGYLLARTDGDATRLDPSMADRIVVGQTTLEDLVQLLGAPHGAARANTSLGDFKEVTTGKEDGMLAWVNAEPVSGVFKLNDVQTTMLIVHIGADHRVIDKTLKTTRISF